MSQEQKDLLLKDLCARLTYGVKAYVKNWSKLDRKYYEGIYDVMSVFPSLNEVHVQSKTGSVDVMLGYTNTDYVIKPYLFPLSSITKEQAENLFKIFGIVLPSTEEDYIKINEVTGITFFLLNGFDVETHLDKLIDWLNKNHFDYRGLIEKGLAIDATNLDIY